MAQNPVQCFMDSWADRTLCKLPLPIVLLEIRFLSICNEGFSILAAPAHGVQWLSTLFQWHQPTSTLDITQKINRDFLKPSQISLTASIIQRDTVPSLAKTFTTVSICCISGSEFTSAHFYANLVCKALWDHQMEGNKWPIFEILKSLSMRIVIWKPSEIETLIRLAQKVLKNSILQKKVSHQTRTQHLGCVFTLHAFPLCFILLLHFEFIKWQHFSNCLFFFHLLIYCSYPLSLLHFVNKMQVIKVSRN